MNCFIESNLFKLPESCSNEIGNSTPRDMAAKFNVPYLGSLPMDPNMMKACEEGRSFVESYPCSVAAKPFAAIVQKIIDMTEPPEPQPTVSTHLVPPPPPLYNSQSYSSSAL